MAFGGEPALFVIVGRGCIQNTGQVGVRHSRQFDRGGSPIDRQGLGTENTQEKCTQPKSHEQASPSGRHNSLGVGINVGNIRFFRPILDHPDDLLGIVLFCWPALTGHFNIDLCYWLFSESAHLAPIAFPELLRLRTVSSNTDKKQLFRN